jgi:hypothetical protein
MWDSTKKNPKKTHTHAQSTNPEAIEVTACYWSKELEARSKQEQETRGTKKQGKQEEAGSGLIANQARSKKQAELSRLTARSC